MTFYVGSAPFEDGDLLVQPPPRVRHLRNAEIMAVAAEGAGIDHFPKTAELAFDGNSFYVVDQGQVLANVSALSVTYGAAVDSGRMNDQTGLAAPRQKRIQRATIQFDDGSTSFTVDGVMTETRTDSEIDTHGTYHEMIFGEFTNGAGWGYSDADGPLIGTCKLRSWRARAN
jgi:hypothetical protein